MLRWTALIGWLACGVIALARLEAPNTLQRTRQVSRRVEHQIRVLGIEWNTRVRESPAPIAPCAGDEAAMPVARAAGAAR
jgi:hypothetical protein